MPGLGKGLGSLIPQKESLTSQVIPQADQGSREIPVDQIRENPYQPRRVFAESELEDLANSIREHGILMPLVVTRVDDGYELIAGERRLRAAKLAGLTDVPAIIRTASDQQKLELALIENIQRQQLNPLEEALSYKALLDEFNLTQAEAAKRVGKSRSEVANTVRLLDLSDEMQNAVAAKKITRSHARTLLSEKDPDKRQQLFEAMLDGGVTVRQAERRVAGRSTSSGGGAARKKDPNIAAHEKTLRELLGTKVEIQNQGEKGKITIHYYSKDELLNLLTSLSEIS